MTIPTTDPRADQIADRVARSLSGIDPETGLPRRRPKTPPAPRPVPARAPVAQESAGGGFLEHAARVNAEVDAWRAFAEERYGVNLDRNLFWQQLRGSIETIWRYALNRRAEAERGAADPGRSRRGN